MTLETWELGVLGIHDHRAHTKLSAWFGFLRDHDAVAGDVAEVGVYRGSSLLASALVLREIGSRKRVVGFDSFSGFPTLHANDDLDRFETMFEAGAITAEHHAKVRRNREHLAAVDRAATPEAASSSGDFAMTSRDLIERKAVHLWLTNIELVEGPYSETMAPGHLPDLRLSAALLDCDLYESHRDALPFVWKRLAPGGFVYLDEYFSLKFPGARIAVDEFFADRDDKPEQVDDLGDGFERWGVYKRGST